MLRLSNGVNLASLTKVRCEVKAKIPQLEGPVILNSKLWK
jgi:hypothetical protein